jgi:hypothetical protein
VSLPESNYERFVSSQKLRKLVVVYGHLWLEHLLLRMLHAVLPKPEAFFRERTPSFPTLVALCEALDVIDPSLGNALRRINTLRNKVAHQAGYDPSESDAQHLRKIATNVEGHDASLLAKDDWDAPIEAIAVLLEELARRHGATDLDVAALQLY